MTSATVATKPAAAQSGQSQAKPEKIRKDHSINWWLTAAVAVLSLTVLVPLYFAVVTALKTPGEAGTFSLPTTWEWHNFADAWNKVNYPKAALNSAIITVCAVVLTLLTNTFVAYAVARNMDKRFFRFLYYFFLAMMFVPFTVVMLPIAKEMGTLHLDNQLGLIILYTILGIGTNLFIAIGFIRSIPISLEEAARIDGASTWRIFWKIIFPLMGPINATIAILTALWAWNDFLLPLITLTDQSNQTIPLAQYVFQSQFTSNYPMAFASYLMAMAPVLIVYIFAQKWVVGGVMRGAEKCTVLWTVHRFLLSEPIGERRQEQRGRRPSACEVKLHSAERESSFPLFRGFPLFVCIDVIPKGASRLQYIFHFLLCKTRRRQERKNALRTMGYSKVHPFHLGKGAQSR